MPFLGILSSALLLLVSVLATLSAFRFDSDSLTLALRFLVPRLLTVCAEEFGVLNFLLLLLIFLLGLPLGLHGDLNGAFALFRNLSLSL